MPDQSSLVVHPRKSDDDRIGLVDIAGSSNVPNMAWNCFAIYCESDANHHPIRGILEVLKNRATGEELPRFDDRMCRVCKRNRDALRLLWDRDIRTLHRVPRIRIVVGSVSGVCVP